MKSTHLALGLCAQLPQLWFCYQTCPDSSTGESCTELSCSLPSELSTDVMGLQLRSDAF